MISTVEDEALALAATYRDAERRIVERIASKISEGLDAPTWEIDSLARAQTLRKEAIEILAQSNAAMAGGYTKLAELAYSQGGAESLLDLPGVDFAHAGSLNKRAAVKAVSSELADTVNAMSSKILRNVDDGFRATIGKVVAATAARGISRRDAARDAMNSFAAQGIGKFTDKSGRNWALGDYVDMATRTGAAKAQMKGHEDTLAANDLDLVVVQPGPRACDICDKWARSILSISGVAGKIKTVNEITGDEMTVTVDDTLTAARAGGFQHPNCRCSLRAYLPGVTKRSDIKRPPWDEEGYKAQQSQRGIEKDIRAAKLQQAAAITPEDRAAAAAKTRAKQAELRDHLDANPALKRQSGREQISGRFATPDERDLYAKSVAARRADKTPKSATAALKSQQNISDSIDDRLAALPRTSTNDGLEAQSMRSNPSYSIDPDYRSNCHYAVSAGEMRTRGYDVIASPTTRRLGRTDASIARDWRTVTGEVREFDYLRDYANNPTLATLKKATADWPIGARGFISGSYKKSRSGHIMNVEKTANGLRIIESQNPLTTAQGATETLRRFRPISIAVFRVDDLVPSEGVLAAVRSVDDVTLALSSNVQRVHTAAQITRLERELAAAEAAFAQLEAADLALLARFREAADRRDMPLMEQIAKERVPIQDQRSKALRATMGLGNDLERFRTAMQGLQ